MRALALGGRVGIESQPRNKYSLGTRARAFSGLLPHSWPCGSSRTLRSPAAATGDLMTVSWEPRASCQPAQPWPGPQACFSLQIIKPQPWATSPPLALCWRDRGRASGRVIPRLSFHASGKNKGRMQGPAYPLLKSAAGSSSRRLGSNACSVGALQGTWLAGPNARLPGTVGSGQTSPATCLLTLVGMPFTVGSVWSPQIVARQSGLWAQAL